jgi:hypothetical protein
LLKAVMEMPEETYWQLIGAYAFAELSLFAAE